MICLIGGVFVDVSKNQTVNNKRSDNPAIRVEELKILKTRLLLYRLSYSKEIKKYFLSNHFFVEYDKDVKNICRGILNIPVISNIITLAWAIGADVYVQELDKTYLESLNEIKKVMEKAFPELPFCSNIYVKKIVSNSFYNKKYALLFSGGIDSTTSYIRHRNKKPDLIMIFGADIPLNYKEYLRKIRNEYNEFATQHNLKINFVKTNMRQFINERLLDKEFGKYMNRSSWWLGIQHGLGLIGICAPITVERVRTILMASSYWNTDFFRHPTGSDPHIDNKISWADVGVVHDGYDFSRQEKIEKNLKHYIMTEVHHPTLRVCTNTPECAKLNLLNCSRCEKCIRTITGLVLENIDPNKCGFNVNKHFFDYVKNFFESGRAAYVNADLEFWKDLQRHIPAEMYRLNDCERQFFEWFKDFEISKNLRKRNLKWWLLYALSKLPKKIRNFVGRFSSFLKIVLKRKTILWAES